MPRNLSNKYEKKLMNTAAKTGLKAAKTASKKGTHKTAEATGELRGYKIAEKIVNQNLYLMKTQEMLKK